MGYTYRKPCRVKKRKEFLRIQDQGRKFRASHFVLVCSKRYIRETLEQPNVDSNPSFLRNRQDRIQFYPQQDTCSRLGVTVTKKVDKRAVGRNLVKRRWREFFRTRVHRIDTGWDFVVIALQGAAEQNHAEFIREAYYLFRKSGLWQERSHERRK